MYNATCGATHLSMHLCHHPHKRFFSLPRWSPHQQGLPLRDCSEGSEATPRLESPRRSRMPSQCPVCRSFPTPNNKHGPPPMHCVGFTHTCPYTRHSTLPTATTLGNPYIYHRQLRLPRTLRHQGLIPFPPREAIAPSAEGFIHANCGFEKGESSRPG